jgi:hypothetical protein
MSLANLFDVKLLEDIIRIKPDDLAPSLGNVVLAIAEDTPYGGEMLFHMPSMFFRMTYPTNNFVNILKTIINNLGSKSFSSLFLNLDMGSGKTHLLTLILHLFVSCTRSPNQCREFIDVYRNRAGYSEDLAGRTIVIALDLRTPQLVYRYLRLTEKMLGAVGAYSAADAIRRSCEELRLPDPRELAEKIPKELNILILVDELHYSAITSITEDQKIVGDIIRFILALANYRRVLSERSSGLVIIAASARRDFERWQEVRDSKDKEFAALIDGFVDQLHRIESTPETRWLSLDDTKKILERRLGLRQEPFDRIFHTSFDKFIERIVKADSDVPEAHHLRSLIKAMAIYTLEAIKAGDRKVTPARFREEVIETLLPGRGFAEEYKSIYSEISNKIKALWDGDKKLMAINAIFSLTITGRIEKLIDMVMIAKTREDVGRDIPIISEAELRDILRTHGLTDNEINSLIEELDKIHPNIHIVSIARGGYAYFVVPFPSIIALYKMMIEDKYRRYLGTHNTLVNTVCNYLQSLSYSDEYIEQKAVENLQELVKKPYSKDKFYIYIYVNPNLLAQLDKAEKSSNSFNDMKIAVMKTLVDRKEHNIVFVLPKIRREVLEGIAHYIAVDEATDYVIKHYIAPLEKPREGDKLHELKERLLETELGDVKAEIGRKLNEALSYLTSSIKSALAEALYYTPKGVLSEPIAVELKEDIRIVLRDIRRALDILRSNRESIIADLGRALAERVSQGYIVLARQGNINVVDLVYRDVTDTLRKQMWVSIQIDTPRLERLAGDKERWIYIPSRVMKSIAESIKNRVEQEFRDNYEVKTEIEENRQYIITLGSKQPKLIEVSQTPSSSAMAINATQAIVVEKPVAREQEGSVPQQATSRDFIEMIDAMKNIGGILWVAIKIDNDSAAHVKRALATIKKYIIELKHENSGK